mmetsp:Transcript_134541/g.429736  ORF Transcript_134541/g.429736 Transcript_134541/m.429736 type:complete len:482 (-) Transcript_134541:138-1583(-)
MPAVNVFAKRMRTSQNKWLKRWGEDAVIGATLCTLGCNGPEMFSNLVSLYTGSDAGFGVVVGSEVFNLMIIVGCSILCAPELPMKLERGPCTRDISFYALSIAMLYWAMLDKEISQLEAWILLGTGVVYVLVVYFTSDIVDRTSRTTQSVVRRLSFTSGHGDAAVIHVKVLSSNEVQSKEKQDEEVIDVPACEGVEAAKSESVPTDKRCPCVDGLFDSVRSTETTDIESHPNVESHPSSEPESHSHPECQDDGEHELTKVHEHDPTIRGAVRDLCHHLCNGSKVQRCMAIPEFIVSIPLRCTLFLVDVKQKKKEGLWLLCFSGSMFWLGMFSFAMLEVANQVSYNIPILSGPYLGITLCAIGTSFPNVLASILLAKQGNCASSIANAFGSNVQNVFVAMAVPWVIYTFTNGGKPIDQDIAGISEGLVWMIGTLVVFVFFVLVPPCCTLTRIGGVIMVLLHVVYFILTSGEFFGWWPRLLKT